MHACLGAFEVEVACIAHHDMRHMSQAGRATQSILQHSHLPTPPNMQVGDQLDRGDNEIQILYFLERLQKEAAAEGGALHILNGNHETMNVGGRFRYATQPGRIDFLRWQLMQSIGASLKVTTASTVCIKAVSISLVSCFYITKLALALDAAYSSFVCSSLHLEWLQQVFLSSSRLQMVNRELSASPSCILRPVVRIECLQP